VGERTWIVNRMKSALARLGIRGFKPKLRKAPERLAAPRTPEGGAIPGNMLDEFRRDMARLAVVREQIEEIEQARLERLEQAPAARPNAMAHLPARIVGVGIGPPSHKARRSIKAWRKASFSAWCCRSCYGADLSHSSFFYITRIRRYTGIHRWPHGDPIMVRSMAL
jgi:transposase